MFHLESSLSICILHQKKKRLQLIVMPSSTPGFFGSFTWKVPLLGMTDSRWDGEKQRALSNTISQFYKHRGFLSNFKSEAWRFDSKPTLVKMPCRLIKFIQKTKCKSFCQIERDKAQKLSLAEIFGNLDRKTFLSWAVNQVQKDWKRCQTCSNNNKKEKKNAPHSSDQQLHIKATAPGTIIQ